MDNPYQFNLHFGGPSYMDAETFVACITDMNKIIHEINNELNQEKAVQLTVYPLKEGSVELWCALLADNSIMGVVQDMVTKDKVDYAANIIAIVGGYFQLKKYLGGKKVEPEQIEKIMQTQEPLVIKNKSGDTVMEVNATTVNIYQNNVIIDKATSDMFDKLRKSHYVKDFILGDNGNNKLFSAEKKDFEPLASKINSLKNEEQTKQETDADANIYVNKIIFHGTEKWQGVYKDQKISFKILDKDFIRQLKNPDVKFNSFSIINCVLQKMLMLDEETGLFVIDPNQYKILKVNSVKDAATDLEMPFG